MSPFVADEVRSLEFQGPQGPPFHPELQAWVEDGVRAGLPDVGFWLACRRGVALMTLSCVLESRRDELADTILLGVMQMVLRAAAEKGTDPFFGLTRLPQKSSSSEKWTCPRRLPPDGGRLEDFATALSDEYENRIQRLPRYEEFAEMLHYDRQRLFDTVRNARGLPGGGAFLGRLLCDPGFAAGVHVPVSAMIDVMGSPGLEFAEIGLLREALRTAEYWFREDALSTDWERGAGTVDTHCDENAATLDGYVAAGASSAAIERWQRCRRDLLLMQPKLKSVDLGRFVAGLESLAGLPSVAKTAQR